MRVVVFVAVLRLGVVAAGVAVPVAGVVVLRGVVVVLPEADGCCLVAAAPVVAAARLAVVPVAVRAGVVAVLVADAPVPDVVAGFSADVAAGLVLADDAGLFVAGVVAAGFTPVPVTGFAVPLCDGLAIAGRTVGGKGCVVVLFIGGSTGPFNESLTVACPTGM